MKKNQLNKLRYLFISYFLNRQNKCRKKSNNKVCLCSISTSHYSNQFNQDTEFCILLKKKQLQKQTNKCSHITINSRK